MYFMQAGMQSRTVLFILIAETFTYCFMIAKGIQPTNLFNIFCRFFLHNAPTSGVMNLAFFIEPTLNVKIKLKKYLILHSLLYLK